MGHFFAELKRRHIYRVAAAYAVVAWVLLQLVSSVAPMLELPAWVGRAFLLLILLAFPIALVFAWIVQLGSGVAPDVRAAPVRRDGVLVGALALLIALGLYQQFAPRDQAQIQEAGVTAAREASASLGNAISLAVLPFANLSADPEQEFFSDGMTDEISGALAKIADLRVVGRASSFQYKKRDGDLRTIGQALGATHLVEGSVRKAGNRVRISAELVLADTGLQIWSENFDRELTDVFAIQEDIAKAIATSLRMPLGLNAGENLVNSRLTDNALHEDYLRAKALVRTRTPGIAGRQGLAELREAARLLEQVVAREPDFAPAWALLGLAYGYIPLRGLAGGDFEQVRAVVADVLPKAEAAALRAIEIDPKNADGYFTLGFIQHVRTKQTLAMDSFAKGMALDPTNPDGLHIYSDTLADLGYVKQALPLRRQLQALEPFVPVYQGITARILQAAGEYDEPIAMFDRRGDFLAVATVELFAAKGQFGKAADVLETVQDLPPATRDAAVRLLRSAPAKADPKTLPDLGRRGRLHYIYAYVGAPERMMDAYDEGVKLGYVGPGDNVYLWTPTYSNVRKTERFKAYTRNVGMVEYWRKAGFTCD
jgi:TolB-like protein